MLFFVLITLFGDLRSPPSVPCNHRCIAVFFPSSVIPSPRVALATPPLDKVISKGCPPVSATFPSNAPAAKTQHRDHNHCRPGLPAKSHSFLPVGLWVDESLPISLPRFSIPVWREAEFGLGLCVELVFPMPGAVGSPPTPWVDGAAFSAARDKPLEPRKKTKAAAAIPIVRRITLS